MAGEYVRDPTTGLLTAWTGFNGTPESRRLLGYRRDPATGLVTATALVPTPDFGELYATDANGLLTPVRNLYGANALVFDFTNGYYQDGAGRWGNDPSLVSGFSYSRTGTEYAQTSSGLLVPFASGVPAVTDLGLQVWEARTNLVTQSQTFDNAAWSKSGASVSADVTAAPDGTVTADRIAATGTFAFGAEVLESPTYTAATYALSVYAKAGTAGWTYLQLGGSGGNGVRKSFNLNTGALGTTQTFGTGWTLTSASITLISGSWYRLVLIGTAPAGANSAVVGTANADSGASITSGQYNDYWGAQLEAASFAGPYIPTTSASATRGAASASVGGLSLPSAALTMFWAAYTPVGVTTDARFALSDGTSTNRIRWIYDGSTLLPIVTAAGANVFAPTGRSLVAGALNKFAISWDGTNWNAAVNGVALVPATGGLPAGMNRLDVGQSNGGGSGYWNAPIPRGYISSQVMSSSQLQALTQ